MHMKIERPADGNLPIIERLQRRLIEETLPFSQGKKNYALLDFPNHPNIGDSAIYVGESILLRRLFGRHPILVTEANSAAFDQIASLSPDIPLFLHGGGNFGDTWPRHQLFREEILARFPEREVIQLPQSIFYSNQKGLDVTAKAIAGHPNFTLMVRDRRSQKLAQDAFDCVTRLVPDMAFMIGAAKAPNDSDYQVLCLIRDDHETTLADTSALSRLPTPYKIVDWPNETDVRSVSDRANEKLRRIVGNFMPSAMSGLYLQKAETRVKTGLALLSRGKFVVTDRLHAHILSVLLGIPHVVLDNFYGKIGGYMEAWTADAAVGQVATLDAAIDTVHASL
jgi:pyruvyl transferase EpsO